MFLMQMNMNNITYYKNNQGLIVYNDILTEQKNENIDFIKLQELLGMDITSFETFVGKDAGSWVDSFKYGNNDILFESRFECGNLRMAIKINENERRSISG